LAEKSNSKKTIIFQDPGRKYHDFLSPFYGQYFFIRPDEDSDPARTAAPLHPLLNNSAAGYAS
jgi:hypothetical protein